MIYDTDEDLLYALSVGPNVIRGLLEGCTQERAAASSGGDEGWSVVEVMCHLRDAEERAVERVAKMRDEDNPFMEGYDQDVWAQERSYATQKLRDVLEGFVRFRAEHVEALRGLAPEGWDRKGLHEERGEITIRGHVVHLILHDTMHAAQIARQLRG